MKKLLLFVVMAFLCLLMTSCIRETKDDQGLLDDNSTVDSDANGNGLESNDNTSDSALETGNGLESNDNTSDSALETDNNVDQNEIHSTPYLISFSSITEMKDFLNSAKGNATQYGKFVQAHNINTSITQKDAQSIVTNVERNDIPLAKSDSVIDDFGATYYLDRNELDIIYKINGIRYRFVYKYNKTSSIDRTTAATLENLNLGAYVVDLYQGDGCFVGELVTDSVVIQIVVYAKQANDIALNVFNMGELSNGSDILI